MNMNTAKSVIAKWAENNIITAFPEDSMERFLAYVGLPFKIEKMAAALEKDDPLGLIRNGDLDLDAVQRVIDTGFSKMSRVRLPDIMSRTFWLNEANARDLLKQLRNACGEGGGTCTT